MRPLELSRVEVEKIRIDWMAGLPIGTICARCHHGTEQIRRLADEEGWPPRAQREPLPPGHAATWAILWRESALAGVAFPQMRMA
jgi:hypothetical protein